MRQIVLSGALARPALLRVVLDGLTGTEVDVQHPDGRIATGILVPEKVTARVEFYVQSCGLDAEPGTVNAAPVAVYSQPLADYADDILAVLVMQGFTRLSATAMQARMGSLRVAAASRLRAGSVAPRGIRQGTGEVTGQIRALPHAGFFALEDHDLQFRRFDGTMSPLLHREIFVAGDAVTVLPYDPGRDRVLVIEQMRTGPYGRGDPLPWQLEAIAGRIDPGESPEDCARREAVEEASLALGRLEKVAEYYPTPGAVTEYLYSYVAIADLPDGIAGVFGAHAEAEDIRGHLLSFDALMAAVAGGEIANAPLILTALWLQRERGRLRSRSTGSG